MNRKICCFAGHSRLYGQNLENEINEILKNLIINYNVKEFWVGNYGDFDRLALNTLKKIKQVYTDIEINLIIPYLTKKITDYKEIYYKNFDNIYIPELPLNTPKKFLIIKANVNESEPNMP